MAETLPTNAPSSSNSLLTPERGGRIPFLTTPPLLDVLLLLALVPVWWALGVDQFVWGAGGLWVALRMGLRRHWQLHFPRTLIVLACFLVVQLISALFIVEPYRYITFARTFGAYVAIFCLALVLVNEVHSLADIKLILRVLIGVVTLMAVLSALAEIRLFRPAFTAPIARLLPASIKATDYGKVVTSRALGNSSWFSLFHSYYRLSGFFLYPTGYALVLMFVIPLALFCFWRARAKIIWAVVVLLLAVNLVFTTGRVALLALATGFGFFMLTASRWRRASRIVLVIGVVSLGLILSLALADKLPSQITTVIDNVVLARGEGSFRDRLAVYVATLQNAVERPVFGWGTERDLPTLTEYPAGSHDYYLGVLYKYGIVGLLVFAALWIVLWRETTPPPIATDAPPDARDLARLLSYGRWIMIGALVNGLSEVLDLDTTVLVFLWVIFVLLICAREQFQSIVST